MKNYWPLSIMLQSPELQPEQKRELMTLQTSHALMSGSTLTACYNLACKTPACGYLALVCSGTAPMRRVYLEYPAQEDWNALERGGFIVAFNIFGFVMDALH